MLRIDMNDWEERPKVCREECQQQKCVGTPCRFLHDEAADHSCNDGKPEHELHWVIQGGPLCSSEYVIG